MIGGRNNGSHWHCNNGKAGIDRKWKELDINPELQNMMIAIQPLPHRNSRRISKLRSDMMLLDSKNCHTSNDSHCWKSRKTRHQWQKHQK